MFKKITIPIKVFNKAIIDCKNFNETVDEFAKLYAKEMAKKIDKDMTDLRKSLYGLGKAGGLSVNDSTPKQKTKTVYLFGKPIKIVLDENIPDDEVRMVSDGKEYRIINIGG